MEEFEKNNSNKDHLAVISDAVQKAVFGIIPAGPLLEPFWNYRANLRQKRATDFTFSFIQIMEDVLGKKLQNYNFQTEEFVDVIEAVYLRVFKTRSKYKLERFRNILVKQLVAPIEYDDTLKFIHILDSLDDIDLFILDKMRNFDDIQYVSNFQKLLIGEDGPYEDDYAFTINAGGNKIELVAGEIDFYVNRLTTLGLFKIRTVSRSSSRSRGKKISTQSYQTYLITNMGKKFLEFIELSEKN